MNGEADRLDLPVPVRDDDLPIPVAIPQQETVFAKYPDWSNWASQCHVRGLAVDSLRGELWLATGGGVLQWRTGLDRFTRYGSEHGLPGNAVRAVAVGGTGQVWAVHDRAGLSYLDGDTWCLYQPLFDAGISCLYVAPSGQLWLGSEGAIYALHSPSEAPVQEIPFAGIAPRALAVTDAGELWLCNAGGVYKQQGHDWVRYTSQPGILTLACQAQNLWLGTVEGLLRVDLSTGELAPAGTWPRSEVSALAPAAAGVWTAVWTACESYVRLATETDWMPIKGKACDRITSLAPAGDGGVWIGTHSGLQHGSRDSICFHLTESPPDVIIFRSPNQPPVTLSNAIQSLALQPLETESVLWIGTPRGLFRLELATETWRRMGKLGTEDVPEDVRSLIFNQSGGQLWVASWHSGLHGLKQQSFKNYSEVPGLILALAAGRGSTCWAASLDGLYRWDGLSWTQILSPNQLPERGIIRALAQTAAESLLIGTSAGLFTYNPDRGFPTPVPGQLGNAEVQSLLSMPERPSDNLWVGTAGGLYCGQPGDLKPVPGLENRAIAALAWQDGTETVWVGTDQGLFRVAQAGNQWEVAERFTVHDSGLASDRITALALDSNESSDTADLWVGTPCGLSRYTYQSQGRKE